MMTWQLWRTFYGNLPKHPLFWQTLNKPAATQTIPQTWREWLKQLGVALIIFIVMLLLIWVIIPLLLLLYLLPVLVAILGAVNAAVGVASSIAYEREQHRYDLIAVTSSGALGMAWALATRFLRTHHRAVRLAYLTRIFHLICLLGGVAIAMMSFATQAFFLTPDFGLAETNLNSALLVMIVIFALHLDFIQAVLIGALIGIAVPTIAPRRFDAAIMAGMSALVCQLMGYVLVWGGVWLMNIVSVGLRGAPLENPLTIAIAVLFLLFTIHEVALHFLWTLITHQLNIDKPTLPFT